MAIDPSFFQLLKHPMHSTLALDSYFCNFPFPTRPINILHSSFSTCHGRQGRLYSSQYIRQSLGLQLFPHRTHLACSTISASTKPTHAFFSFHSLGIHSKPTSSHRHITAQSRPSETGRARRFRKRRRERRLKPFRTRTRWSMYATF